MTEREKREKARAKARLDRIKAGGGKRAYEAAKAEYDAAYPPATKKKAAAKK